MYIWVCAGCVCGYLVARKAAGLKTNQALVNKTVRNIRQRLLDKHERKARKILCTCRLNTLVMDAIHSGVRQFLVISG